MFAVWLDGLLGLLKRAHVLKWDFSLYSISFHVFLIMTHIPAISRHFSFRSSSIDPFPHNFIHLHLFLTAFVKFPLNPFKLLFLTFELFPQLGQCNLRLVRPHLRDILQCHNQTVFDGFLGRQKVLTFIKKILEIKYCVGVYRQDGPLA
jgi:hypothetical protein